MAALKSSLGECNHRSLVILHNEIYFVSIGNHAPIPPPVVAFTGLAHRGRCLSAEERSSTMTAFSMQMCSSKTASFSKYLPTAARHWAVGVVFSFIHCVTMFASGAIELSA